MSDRRDTPRGPTATELHRRALAMEYAADVEATSPGEAGTKPCGCTLNTKCLTHAMPDFMAGLAAQSPILRHPPLASLPYPPPPPPLTRRCGYCGALSPQGCNASPCSFHGG